MRSASLSKDLLGPCIYPRLDRPHHICPWRHRRRVPRSSPHRVNIPCADQENTRRTVVSYTSRKPILTDGRRPARCRNIRQANGARRGGKRIDGKPYVASRTHNRNCLRPYRGSLNICHRLNVRGCSGDSCRAQRRACCGIVGIRTKPWFYGTI